MHPCPVFQLLALRPFSSHEYFTKYFLMLHYIHAYTWIIDAHTGLVALCDANTTLFLHPCFVLRASNFSTFLSSHGIASCATNSSDNPNNLFSELLCGERKLFCWLGESVTSSVGTCMSKRLVQQG